MPNQTKTDRPEAFILPPRLTGQTEVNRLLRELQNLSEQTTGKQSPKVTSLLEEVATANGYRLTEEYHRQHLREQLQKIHDLAPVLHISFASEPSPSVTEKVLAWLRDNVHRYALLQIGLQPGIAAGCVLRTANKVFDMSLGASLEKQKNYLLQLISAAVEAKATPEKGSIQ